MFPGPPIESDLVTKARSVESVGELFRVKRIIGLETKDESIIGYANDYDLIGNTWVVVDNVRKVVLQFADDGSFLRQIGRRGEGPGEYQGPKHVVEIGSDIGISDPGRKRIHVYDIEGNYRFYIAPANSAIYINSHVQAHGNQLFVCNFPTTGAEIPLHVVLDIDGRAKAPTITGFGERFSFLIENESASRYANYAFQAFELIGDRLWVMPPYQAEVEVFDLDGVMLGRLPTGIDGRNRDDFRKARTQSDFMALHGLTWPYRIIEMNDLVFAYFLGRKKRMTIFDRNGNLVRKNMEPKKFPVWAINGTCGGAPVSFADLSTNDASSIEEKLGPDLYTMLLSAGYDEESPADSNPFVFIFEPNL